MDTQQLPIITSQFERLAGADWSLRALADPQHPQRLCQTFDAIIAERRDRFLDVFNIHTVTNSTPSRGVKPPKRLQSDPVAAPPVQRTAGMDAELDGDATSMATVGPVPDGSFRMSKKAAAKTSRSKAGSEWWSPDGAAQSVWDGRNDAVTTLWCARRRSPAAPQWCMHTAMACFRTLAARQMHTQGLAFT